MPQLNRDLQWKNKRPYIKRDGTEVSEHRQRYGVKTESTSKNLVVSADLVPETDSTAILVSKDEGNEVNSVIQSIPMEAEDVVVEEVNEDNYNIRATGKKVIVDKDGNIHEAPAVSSTMISRMYKTGVRE